LLLPVLTVGLVAGSDASAMVTVATV